MVNKKAVDLANLGSWPKDQAEKIAEDIFQDLFTYFDLDLIKNYWRYDDPDYIKMGDGFHKVFSKTGTLGDLSFFKGAKISNLNTGIRLRTPKAQHFFNSSSIILTFDPKGNSGRLATPDHSLYEDLELPSTVEVNIGKILFLFFNNNKSINYASDVEKKIEIVLRHELLHLIDLAYKGKYNFKQDSKKDYFSQDTELKSLADTVAYEVIQEHALKNMPLRTKQLLGLKPLSDFTFTDLDQAIKSGPEGSRIYPYILPKDKKNFLIRVYKRIQEYLRSGVDT